MKALLKFLLKLSGFQIHRIKKPHTAHYFRNEQMIQGFKHIYNLNIEIKTIIDIGASEGSWALSAKEIWPNCNFLLFEPLAERKSGLELLIKQHTKFYLAPYAAGNSTNSINFYVSDDLDGSGIADETNHNKTSRNVKTTTVDNEVSSRKLSGPYLVKLDTHGFEIPILEGCVNILKEVSVFIIECYGFKIANNSLTLWEMCQYMDGCGFRLYNIVDTANRPKDFAFWQCDAFFLRKEHSLFQSNTFY